MAGVKTVKNDADVDAFLASVEHDIRREDARAVRELMADITGDRGSMWGDSIVGFGERPLPYPGGNDWFVVGFSPRKRNLVLYIMDGFDGYQELLGRLGRHDTGRACLYLNRLEQVDLAVLAELIRHSVDATLDRSADDNGTLGRSVDTDAG
jgi:hypothetical protein